MKVLSIGNSFSQDAHKWLHKVAEKNGVEVETANLYIGGCTLEKHWKNFLGNKADYSLELNGEKGERYVSLYEALTMDEWDVVTIQQASALSGRPQSYFPYLPNIAELVRQFQPSAKIYFYQTWSYETDIESASFNAYNRDQKEMYRRIEDTSEMAAKVIGAPIIYVGRVIQNLRENVEEFDYQKGGLSLNRDGYHLTLDYGRFAAAATFFCTLTGKRIEIDGFEGFDSDIVKKIIKTVEETVFGTEEK